MILFLPEVGHGVLLEMEMRAAHTSLPSFPHQQWNFTCGHLWVTCRMPWAQFRSSWAIGQWVSAPAGSRAGPSGGCVSAAQNPWEEQDQSCSQDSWFKGWQVGSKMCWWNPPDMAREEHRLHLSSESEPHPDLSLLCLFRVLMMPSTH